MRTLRDTLPDLLKEKIEAGVWGSKASIIEGQFKAAQHPELKGFFPLARMDCFCMYDFDSIDRESLSEIHPECKELWEGTRGTPYKPGYIDPSKIAIIGDYGIDSPIAVGIDSDENVGQIFYLCSLERNLVWVEATGGLTKLIDIASNLSQGHGESLQDRFCNFEI